MSNAREQMPIEQVTAEQLARLLKENEELKLSLTKVTGEKQASETKLTQRESELLSLQTSTFHFQSTAEKKNESLEQSQEELRKTQVQLAASTAQIKALQKENQSQQTQLESQQEEIKTAKATIHKKNLRLDEETKKHCKELDKLNADIESSSGWVRELSNENNDLKQEIAQFKKKAAKTPRWKIIFGVGLFITGALLTATGIGSAAGVPMMGLAIAAFSVGVTTLVGGFLYGVYKAVRACCFPSKQTIDDDPDTNLSSSVSSGGSEDPDQSIHHGTENNVTPGSPVARQDSGSSSPKKDNENKTRDERRRVPDISFSNNPNRLLATRPDARQPHNHTEANQHRRTHGVTSKR